VGFSSTATNLVSPVVTGSQVYVRDMCKSSGTPAAVNGCTPLTALVSANDAGPTGGSNAAITHDSHFVAYEATVSGVAQILLAASGF
jgi:hypothetical protein